MSSPNKVNFGSNNAPSYSLNNNNYGYTSGEQVQSSYSPAHGNVGTSSIGHGYDAPRDTGFAHQGGYTTGQSFGDGNLGHSNLHIQPGAIQGRQYGQVRDINHPAPVTKVNFGTKTYTQTYSPHTNYQAPPPAQTYKTYHQPVQIHSVPVVQQQIRQEQRYEAPRVEAHQGSHVSGGAVDTDKKKKKKKKGCPGWLWPLLGLLALLALIIGLLFGLGVFGGKSGSSGAHYNDKQYTVVEQEAILSTDNDYSGNNNNGGFTPTPTNNNNNSGFTPTPTPTYNNGNTNNAGTTYPTNYPQNNNNNYGETAPVAQPVQTVQPQTVQPQTVQPAQTQQVQPTTYPTNNAGTTGNTNYNGNTAAGNNGYNAYPAVEPTFA